MPKQVNRYPGIKSLDVGYQARVYHHGFEESRTFRVLDEAKRWQTNLKKDLERTPEGIRRRNKVWAATAIGPDGVASESFEILDDAIQWRSEAIVLLARGEQPPISSKTVKFGVFAEQWLREKYPNDTSRKGTYASQLKLHVNPTLGSKDLRELSSSQIQEWIELLKEEGVGVATIRGAATVVRQVLRYAVQKRHIPKTVWVEIDLPSSKKSDRARAFSLTQLWSIAEKCGRYQLLVLLLGLCGLRIGEATALRREHIDFEAGVIRVEKAWKRYKTGKRYIGLPKNGKGRDVPIPRILREDLLSRCSGLSEEDFLFVGEKGGPLNSDHFRKRWFLPALRELAIRNAGIHMLRHTCASLLIRQNTPITTVSQILGHSDVQITLKTYAHFFVEDSFEAMEKLSQHVESFTE